MEGQLAPCDQASARVTIKASHSAGVQVGPGMTRSTSSHPGDIAAIAEKSWTGQAFSKRTSFSLTCLCIYDGLQMLQIVLAGTEVEICQTKIKLVG